MLFRFQQIKKQDTLNLYSNSLRFRDVHVEILLRHGQPELPGNPEINLYE